MVAKHGLSVPMTDLFGVGGRQLLARWCAEDARFHSAYGQRIESIVVLVDALTHEIDELSTRSLTSWPVTPATTPSRRYLVSAR